jgi:hypothetical protein
MNVFFLKALTLRGLLAYPNGRGISPTKGLYRHRTTQQRNARTHMNAPSSFRTWDPNVRAVVDSTCLDRSAIETGVFWFYSFIFMTLLYEVHKANA